MALWPSVVRAIGNDLHMDYSAIGQTTHLAARMEQLATPGSILLPADTLRLVEGLVQVRTTVWGLRAYPLPPLVISLADGHLRYAPPWRSAVPLGAVLP